MPDRRLEFITQRQLADEACKIEIDILKEPIGEQGQYMAAFGGLTCLTFRRRGDVMVELAHSETWEQPVSFAPQSAGAHQSVELSLYRGGDAEPYLNPLRLWIAAPE